MSRSFKEELAKIEEDFERGTQLLEELSQVLSSRPPVTLDLARHELAELEAAVQPELRSSERNTCISALRC